MVALEGLPKDISPEDVEDICQLVVTIMKDGRLTLVPKSDEDTRVQLAAVGEPRRRCKKGMPIPSYEKRQARVAVDIGEDGAVICRPAIQEDLDNTRTIVSLRELQEVPKVNDPREAKRRLTSARRRRTTVVLHGQPGLEPTRRISREGEVIKTEPDISDHKLAQLVTLAQGGFRSPQEEEKYANEFAERERKEAEERKRQEKLKKEQKELKRKKRGGIKW